MYSVSGGGGGRGGGGTLGWLFVFRFMLVDSSWDTGIGASKSMLNRWSLTSSLSCSSRQKLHAVDAFLQAKVQLQDAHVNGWDSLLPDLLKHRQTFPGPYCKCCKTERFDLAKLHVGQGMYPALQSGAVSCVMSGCDKSDGVAW